MRFLPILAACLCLSPGVLAQDDRVHPYMRAVSDQFRLDEGYLIEMEYIREDIMRETSVSGTGTIRMKGVQYKIILDEFIAYFDGETLYSQNTELREVYVSRPDPGSPGYLEAVPIRVIKSYQNEFRYQYMGERPFRGKNRVEIQLYPLEPTGPYSMLNLFIHPVTLKLEGFLLKHKEGIHYTMILNSVQGGQSFPDSLFRFDPSAYPGTEIIELID